MNTTGELDIQIGSIASLEIVGGRWYVQWGAMPGAGPISQDDVVIRETGDSKGDRTAWNLSFVRRRCCGALAVLNRGILRLPCPAWRFIFRIQFITLGNPLLRVARLLVTTRNSMGSGAYGLAPSCLRVVTRKGGPGAHEPP